MKIEDKDFGLGARLITIENDNGVSISFTNLGARIVSWKVQDNDIVLGFDSANEYFDKDLYPGATIGRTAGRIKDGIINVNGKNIQLNQNEAPKTLHGGEGSFESKLWRYEIVENDDSVSVKFYLTSSDGENGYPGKLDVTVVHSFDNSNNWTIGYSAQSDKDTVFNPTGHVYFNLNGDASLPIDNHELQLAASRYVPLKDNTQVVRGDIEDVDGTGFDFRTTKELKETFASEDEQIKLVGGLDHPFLLDEENSEIEQARLTLDNLSVSVKTNQPSIVIFTANFGDDGAEYHGKKQVNHGGITFECQVSPGSEQMPELGAIHLNAGEVYKQCTTYNLEVK